MPTERRQFPFKFTDRIRYYPTSFGRKFYVMLNISHILLAHKLKLIKGQPMYRKILILSVIAFQTSCATYKEPKGNSLTLAIVKGSTYHTNFCNFGSTVLSKVDGQSVGEAWSASSTTKITPGEHKFTLYSNINAGCPPMDINSMITTDLLATLKAGNEYQFISKIEDKKILVTIHDKNGNKIKLTNIGSTVTYTNPYTVVHLVHIAT